MEEKKVIIDEQSFSYDQQYDEWDIVGNIETLNKKYNPNNVFVKFTDDSGSLKISYYIYDMEERVKEEICVIYEEIELLLKKYGYVFYANNDGTFSITMNKSPEKPDWYDNRLTIDNIKRNTRTSHSDWKTLDVNCLPEDILVGDYEFQYYSEEVKVWRKSAPKGYSETNMKYIFSLISDSLDCKYRYRPTPTKPTHEELAEEYVESNDFFLNSKTDAIKRAFIAGRKSMEGEK